MKVNIKPNKKKPISHKGETNAKPNTTKKQIKGKVKKPLVDKTLTEQGKSELDGLLSFFGISKKKRKGNKRAPVKAPTPNPLTAKPKIEERREFTVPSSAPSARGKREFSYVKPINYEPNKVERKKVVVEEVKEERVLMKRPVLETVTDLTSIGLFSKIGLVNYANQLDKGKFEERKAKEEYNRNADTLRRENSLKFFIHESAKRNLEFSEDFGIQIQIDTSIYSLQDLHMVMNSKLLSSYKINIIKNDGILTKMGVDPILINVELKKF